VKTLSRYLASGWQNQISLPIDGRSPTAGWGAPDASLTWGFRRFEYRACSVSLGLGLDLWHHLPRALGAEHGQIIVER
jgi:hypothetical protein